jgi:hypothetical protein
MRQHRCSVAGGREAETSRTISSENVEKVEKQRIFDVTHVLCSCLLEGGTVDDPSLAFENDISL